MRRYLLGLTLALAPGMWGQSLAGLWDAGVTNNGLEIPFRFEISGQAPNVKGSFFNGDVKVTSTTGAFENGRLSLDFDFYAAKLTASYKDGALEGEYVRAGRVSAFHARRFAPSPLTAEDVPLIGGLWEIPTKSSKGELAWRFIVRQAGPEVSAAILRVDGDTGSLTGTYRNGKFVLSHFDGARPLLMEVAPQKDGSLEIVQNGKDKMTAVRSAAAREKGLPEPTDPSRHTTLSDPTEPLQFRFPDLNGKMVANTDERFRNKVLVVSIGGSWCPNCHDEAPFLVELYRQYHARGLEVVSLSFEEADQLKDPVRLRAFIQHYGIEYPVLIGGETSQLREKMPQAVNLNSWPTTFFLGRDGRVRSIHAGFAGPASGSFHDELKSEVTHLIEKLLTEDATQQ